MMAFSNRCGGMEGFVSLRGDRVTWSCMYYAGFYRERCPGAHRLCAVLHALLHWRSSVRRVLQGKCRTNLTRNVPEPRIGYPTGGIVRGGQLARARLWRRPRLWSLDRVDSLDHQCILAESDGVICSYEIPRCCKIYPIHDENPNL